MTVFTLIVVLVATTASALTMTLAYTMTKRLVASETKQLHRQLHQAQLKLRHTQEKLESAERIAYQAIQARDYYKSLQFQTWRRYERLRRQQEQQLPIEIAQP